MFLRRSSPERSERPVRAEWPAERPLTVCLLVSDELPGGLELGEALEIARQLRERGCDAVEVAAGQTTPAGNPSYGRHFLTPLSDAVRNGAGALTIARGGITSADAVNTIVAAGRADLCVLDARGLGSAGRTPVDTRRGRAVRFRD